MKATQLFRDQLGLSQEVIAQYLGITRSQLAMYEAGKRGLPTTALVKLADIALFFEQKETKLEESQILIHQELEVQALLVLQAKELQYKQIKEQRLLENIQKKYKQNLKLYAFAQHSINNTMSLTNALLQQAIIGMERNNIARQTQQLIKLQGIKSQLDYINSLKEK